MRLLFFLLVVVNVGFYALYQGYFGPLLPNGRDPVRVEQQILPQAIHVSAADPAAPRAGPGARSTCVEFGGFSGDDVKKVEGLLEPLAADGRMTQRHADEQASFIVYLPPFKSKADADHASAELKRIGVNDFFIIQDAGPFKLAISLGIFRSEDAAKAQLTSLTQLGVKNAKTGLRATTVAKTYYLFHNSDAELVGKLTEIKQQFPNEDLHDCAISASSSSANSVSGTTPPSPATSTKGT